MKLAVKLYQDLTTEENLICGNPFAPGIWPALVLELADDAEIPSGYSEMSVQEYNDYRQEHMQEYLDAMALEPTE